VTPEQWTAVRRAWAERAADTPPIIIHGSKEYLDQMQAEYEANRKATEAFRARLPQILAELERNPRSPAVDEPDLDPIRQFGVTFDEFVGGGPLPGESGYVSASGPEFARWTGPSGQVADVRPGIHLPVTIDPMVITVRRGAPGSTVDVVRIRVSAGAEIDVEVLKLGKDLSVAVEPEDPSSTVTFEH
jgi:hypothetical protein